jgi:hypothetical protein
MFLKKKTKKNPHNQMQVQKIFFVYILKKLFTEQK